jgi:hypothetical protein
VSGIGKIRRTLSWTSKANHSQLINDEYIQDFLKGCNFPTKPDLNNEESESLVISTTLEDLRKKHVLTVEGDYTIVKARAEFPSSEIAFFQFGAVLLSIDDLDDLSTKSFISPEDMKTLHNLQRGAKLALPVKNLVSNNQTSLNESIRTSIYSFFLREKDNLLSLMDTLSWLIFEEYLDNPKEEYKLASNPNLGAKGGEIALKKSEMSSDFTFQHESGTIFLTDIFRLHEAIDEDSGAAGILGYISRLIEQLLLIRYLHIIYKSSPSRLNEFIFVSNGPLSFSGETANMHKPLRNLCNFLINKKKLCLFGLEKSGPFVEHAIEICKSEESKFYLQKGNILILSNDYIYKYIKPGDAARMHFGSTSYYGGKIILHTDEGQIFVITIPVRSADVILSPRKEDYENLDMVMSVLKRLKCDMYDDTIISIAIANKLIALKGHSGQAILERFTKNAIDGK